jgi:hypothetical protein
MGKEGGKNRHHRAYCHHQYDPCFGISVVKSLGKLLKRIEQMQVCHTDLLQNKVGRATGSVFTAGRHIPRLQATPICYLNQEAFDG